MQKTAKIRTAKDRTAEELAVKERARRDIAASKRCMGSPTGKVTGLHRTHSE
jgi:hypothetical protein